MFVKPALLKRAMPFWPPLFGAGIRIEEFADDGSRVVVSHSPNRLTKNIVGTAFGGTILAMTDPFFMLAAMTRLGDAYFVRDVGGAFEFKRPGMSTLIADMRISEEDYETIRSMAAGGKKYIHEFTVDVVDEDSQVVAEITRRVYFRRKVRHDGRS